MEPRFAKPKPPTHAQLRAWARSRRRPLDGRWVKGVCGILRGTFYCLGELGGGWAAVSNREGGECVGVFPSWKLRPI